MEEQKNNEIKSGSTCCSHSNKESKCCGSHHGRIQMLIKIVVVLAILLVGVCIGSRANRHENERSLENNFRGQNDCPMMRENKEGANCPCQNKVITPSPVTATTTK